MEVRQIFLLIAVAAFSVMCFLIPAHSLSAADLSVSPGEIWLNDGSPMVSISFKCLNNSENDSAISNVSASVSGPGGYSTRIERGTFNTDSQHFWVTGYPLSLSTEGLYTVSVSCESNGTQASMQTSFWVSSFSTSISRVNSASSLPGTSGILYGGDKVTVEVIARTIGKTNDYVASGAVNFQAYLGDHALSVLKATPPGSAGSPWIIEAAVPSGLEGTGSANLKVVASYNSHVSEVSAGGTFSVENPLEVTIMPPEKPYYFTEASGMNLTVEIVSTQGLSIDPAKIKFRAKFDGDSRPVLSSRNTEGSLWNVELTIPKKTPSSNSYPLDIIADYGNASQQSEQSLPIWFTVPFKGQLVDSLGNPIQARLLVGEDRIIDTGQSGNYEANITPGNYDIELIMTDLTDVKYRGVEVDEGESFKYSRSPLKYESFDGSSQEAARIIALEFGYSFTSADITIPYDPYGLDKNNLVVYQCSNWNFPKRTCGSSWKPITDLSVDNYAVAFSTGSFFRTAFAIGEKKSISSQLDDANRKDYSIGEMVEVKGKVTDSQNNPISGASVNLSLRGNDAYASTTSDSDGNFQLSFSPPQSEGQYTAEIRCQKEYLGARVLTFNFKVSAKEALAWSMQNYADLDFGKLVTITGTLGNVGQKKVQNISLSVNNPPFPGFRIEPQEIESLDIGEQKDVTITIKLNSDECSNCQSQYSVEMEARDDSSGADSKGTFILNMKDVANKDAQPNVSAAASSPEGTASSAGSRITGFAAAETSMISGKISEATQMLSAYSAIDIFLALLIIVLGCKVLMRRRGNAETKTTYQAPPQVQYHSDPIEKIRDVKREILKGEEEKSNGGPPKAD